MKLRVSTLLALLLVAGVARAEDARLAVAVVPASGAASARLRERIALDPRSVLVSDVAAAEAIVVLADASAIEVVSAARARGAGVVLVAGEGAELGFLGIRARTVLEPSVGVEAGTEGPLVRHIAWGNAPKLRARVILDGDGQRAVTTREGPVALVRDGLVVLGLAPSHASNEALWRWGYWSYLLHTALFTAAGRTPDTFAAWPASPMPQTKARLGWMLFLGTIWPLSIWLFARARKAARSPEPVYRQFLDRLSAERGDGRSPSAWNRVGFSRPLGGFFVLIGALCVFIAPYIGLVQYVVPTFVQKFPEVDGLWSSVYDFFWFVWILFDMGTSTAFVKYFAELRQKDPEEALHTMQFFNWWQILTGAIQVTLIALVGVLVLPHTRLALFSDLVALYGLSQWPGVFFAFAFFFQAAQRYDYAQALDLMQNRFLVVVGPIPFVILFRVLFAGNLVYGEGLGAAYGMAIGFNVMGLVVLAVSYALYRRTRLPARPLFLAGFTKRTAVRILRYGSKVMVAGFLFRFGSAIEVVLMGKLLLAYAENIGIKAFLDNNFFFLFRFLAGWSDASIAAFSEAHSAGKMALLRYYLARYLQYGYLFCALLFSFLVALSPPFIRNVLDVRWAAAAPFVLATCVRGLFLPTAYFLDSMQKGCGQPGWNIVLLVSEQLTRMVLYVVLIPRYQIGGVFAAFAAGLFVKSVVGWVMVDRAIVRLRLPLWSTFGAPLLAGALNLLLWWTLRDAMSSMPKAQAIALMLGAGIASFPLCFFLCGLCGGFDPRGLEELREGARMGAVFAPVARVLAACGRAGARLLPVRGTFPVELANAAEREAREIEAAQAAALAMRPPG